MSAATPSLGAGIANDVYALFPSAAWPLRDACRAVSMGPGQIAFTVIPWEPSSCAMVCVKPITANLEAQYAARFGKPRFPAPEAILIIRPLEPRPNI